MRPIGTHKCSPQRLTRTEIAKLKRMTLRGKKGVEIARALLCSISTVQRHWKTVGIGRYAELTPELSAKIVELLRDGMGQHRIAKTLRVPFTEVHALRELHGIKHKPGDPAMRRIPKEKFSAIVELLKTKKFYCNQIARKVGANNQTVLSIAHWLYGPARFVAKWEPLSSIGSEQPMREAKPDSFVQTLSTIIEKCFDGRLPKPENDEAFLAQFMTHIPPGTMQAVIDETTSGWKRALTTLRAARDARWAN